MGSIEHGNFASPDAVPEMGYGLLPHAAVAGASTRARAFFGAPITGLVTFAANPVEDIRTLEQPSAVLPHR